jgi:alpha-glucoside transport system substrate-binding protein
MRTNVLATALTTLAVVVAACGGSGGTAAPAGSGGAAASGDLAGKVIKVMGGFSGAEGDNFVASVKPFEDQTGVDIQYNGVSGMEQQLNVAVTAGNPPDVALIPQPGVMKNYAKQGKLFPLPDDILASIDTNYGPGWKELATADDGKVYGVFHRVNVKAQVFYPKAAFDAKGYKAPKTWDELKALQTQMSTDGIPPWCIGLDVGWPATDWMEAIMLRTVGTDGYDKWTSHAIPFTDPTVKTAATTMMEIMGSDKLAYGGPTYEIQTKWDVPPKLMFSDPPQCWLTNMGNFVTAAFTDDVNADLDNKVGVFELPSIDASKGAVALVGGDQLSAFADRPEIWAFLKYMSTPEASVSWAKAGGALFPYKSQDLSNYPSQLYKTFAENLSKATNVRFDGSDLMPSAVGAGSFWSEMLKMVGGQDIDTTLKNIDATWPTS